MPFLKIKKFYFDQFCGGVPTKVLKEGVIDFEYIGGFLLVLLLRSSARALQLLLLLVLQPLCCCQQETQAKALITSERSCFADLFALFSHYLVVDCNFLFIVANGPISIPKLFTIVQEECISAHTRHFIMTLKLQLNSYF